MPRNEAIKYLIIRSIGNFLLIFAIFGVIGTFGPSLYYEVVYRLIDAKGVEYIVPEDANAFEELAKKQKKANEPSFSDLLQKTNEIPVNPPDTDFSIVVPKIGASSRVVANVDPSDENKYLPALKEGVAHAQGSVFPGLSGNIYLFSHSADTFWNVGRYNAIFYLIKNLVPGDEIVLFFEGKRYNYIVTDSKIVDPKDVSFITQAQTGGEQLILQTCWPPGTTLDRLLVFARPRKTDVIFK